MVGIDRVLIGDNPFNLVDHLSQKRARSRPLLSSEDIARIIRCALESGATGFTFSSTKRAHDALSVMRGDGCCQDFGLYPVFPDVNELARTASEGGLVHVAKELLADSSLFSKAGTTLGAGTALLRADPAALLRTYLSAELSSLRRVAPAGSRVKAVFLHEIITELIISFKLDEIFRSYTDFIRGQYNAIPGVVTRNFPSLVRFTNGGGFGELAVLTPFNRVGFQMNPSRKECERTLADGNSLHVIAMSILAGGHLGPQEAIDYLLSLSKPVSVVVGVSSTSHARDSFSLLTCCLNRLSGKDEVS